MEQFDPRQVKHRDAQELAQGYSKGIRRFEIACIALFAVAVTVQAIRMVRPAMENPWLMVAAFAAGYLFADFVSGFVHWLADTWGSVDMPIIGKALLRPFREHHVDQKAIIHHDFIETNGNNCGICVPAGLAALFVPLEDPLVFFLMAWLLWSMIWVMGTNQFHKWAHMDRPPGWVAVLQKLHLVLPPEHHQIHHTPPYATHYCITTGWLNRPLAAIRFFRVLEWIVTTTTGVIPRADDLGVRAALAVQEAVAVKPVAVPADERKAPAPRP
ncbi:MAG: fatty acid desaturase family protein [Myxococcaceae bacterium]|nr:fatty acid desaturase family protein [Myxococcaceae bacterium]